MVDLTSTVHKPVNREQIWLRNKAAIKTQEGLKKSIIYQIWIKITISRYWIDSSLFYYWTYMITVSHLKYQDPNLLSSLLYQGCLYDDTKMRDFALLFNKQVHNRQEDITAMRSQKFGSEKRCNSAPISQHKHITRKLKKILRGSLIVSDKCLNTIT